MIVKLVRLNDIGCYFTEIALHTITAHAHTGVFKNYLQKLGGRLVQGGGRLVSGAPDTPDCTQLPD